MYRWQIIGDLPLLFPAWWLLERTSGWASSVFAWLAGLLVWSSRALLMLQLLWHQCSFPEGKTHHEHMHSAFPYAVNLSAKQYPPPHNRCLCVPHGKQSLSQMASLTLKNNCFQSQRSDMESAHREVSWSKSAYRQQWISLRLPSWWGGWSQEACIQQHVVVLALRDVYCPT